jgi:hypothetical protein
MSDNYRIICSAKKIENPQDTADKVLGWLQNNKIIESEKSDCVLSTKKLGYKPSDNHLEAVMYDENISKWKICGVEVQTEREVFNAMAFTPFISLGCPECGKNRFEGISPADFYGENLSDEQMDSYQSVFMLFENWSNKESALLTCPFCKKNSDIGEYTIGDGICLSNFGLTFWNWPEFKPEFIDKLKRLINEEIKVIVGHI